MYKTVNVYRQNTHIYIMLIYFYENLKKPKISNF